MRANKLRRLKSGLWLLRIITASAIITGAIATMALAESTMPMSVQLIAVVNLLLSLGGLYKAHTLKLEIEEAEQDEG